MRTRKFFDHDDETSTPPRASTDSILAMIFKDMLVKLGADKNHAFNMLMNRFLTDPKNGIPANIKERSSARGNITKELLRDHMTWKVFCKGIRFLNVPRFHISLCLVHRNGKRTYHHQTVVMDDEFVGGDTIQQDSQAAAEHYVNMKENRRL